MDRRQFLRIRKSTIADHQASATTTRGLQSGLNTYSGNWTMNEVAHLLKRTMFGATKSDIDHFMSISMEDAVDELLNTIPSVDPPVRDYGLMQVDEFIYDDLGVQVGQTWVNDFNRASDPLAKGTINALRVESMRKWWVGLMIHQNRSISEKMLLFWHHHFSVQIHEVENATLLYRHHDLLRRNVLGNVKELTKNVSIDPAMLVHLNGYLNSKLAPDENFARELQELFTVGKGNNSLYTEDDVIEAARVLTGWRIDAETMTSFPKPDAHDTGTKSFSAFYNNTSISGGQGMLQELEQFIDMIFATEEASKFICRKLYRWFVYSNIDEDTEANVITPLAQLLKDNSFEIRPVLAALLKSEHFFDPGNQSCYIKSPYDFIVGSIRELNVAFPPYTDHINGYPLFYAVYHNAADMQQDLFQPPDVSGWPAYYQEPMLYEMWVTSNSLPRRAAFTDSVFKENLADLRAYAAYSSDPADPGRLIDDVTRFLLRYPLSADSKLYVKNSFLINHSGDDSVWTNAWNSNNHSVIDPSLKNMFRFLTSLPEFHLC